MSIYDPESDLSFGRRLTALAVERPNDVAIYEFGTERRSITWRELDRASNRVARSMSRFKIEVNSLVAIGLPNSIEHIVSTFAAWKVGACVLPLNPRMPAREQARVLDLAKPQLCVADWKLDVPRVSLDELRIAMVAPGISAEILPDVIPPRARAIMSGGSTGDPKLIMLTQPGRLGSNHSERANSSYVGGSGTGLIPGPFYHSAPFTVGHTWMLNGLTLAIMTKFVAEDVLSIVERLGVEYLLAVPTMLIRMVRSPQFDETDLSSIRCLLIGAAAVPDWLMNRMIEVLGPTNVLLGYGAAERQGFTQIRGDEWLDRPGSVGKGRDTDIRILGADGQAVPEGEVGEVFLRTRPPQQTFEYIGAPGPVVTDDGFVATGDLGRVDSEGYLFLADRVRDEIKSGGVAVFPAMVEAALLEHPSVVDAAVIGLPDDDWGQRVHAIVQLEHAARLSQDELREFVGQRLSAPNVPKSFEVIGVLPRTEAGKLNRQALVRERVRSNSGHPSTHDTEWGVSL